jgi:hypothetical protein
MCGKAFPHRVKTRKESLFNAEAQPIWSKMGVTERLSLFCWSKAIPESQFASFRVVSGIVLVFAEETTLGHRPG